MRTHSPYRTKAGRQIYFTSPISVIEYFYTTPHQVNLLIFLIGACTAICYFTHFIILQSSIDIIFFSSSLIILPLVILLNWFKKYQFANVLFYVALNMISLIILRKFPEQPAEVILMYIFILSLVIFLFQDNATRLVCICIILLRIIFFELNLKHTNHLILIAPATNEQARIIYDGVVLGLILLVFGLYALKIYAAEKIQNNNALFAQHMSHDLQVSYNSLSSIIAHLKDSRRKNWSPDTFTTLINELANASGFFSYILNNFLEFSRYESGKIGANHYEEIDLEAELQKIVDLYKYMAEAKGIHLALLVDDRLPGWIFSDKIKITRIVLNLLTNALNNTERGKKITINVSWKNGPWELSVINEGEKLSSDQLQQLFIPYQSQENLPGKKRLGLGLPITKQLTEALGGSIRATSIKDQETRFTVAFPME